MSVHKNENPVGSSMQDAMSRAQAASGGGSGSTPPGGGESGSGGSGGSGGPRRSIFGINSRLSRPVERASTGESIKKFVDALNKEGENSFKNSDRVNYSESFDLHVLDSQSDQVALSSILVCFKQAFGGQVHVGVFTLIVEGSGTLRSNRFVPISGKQVEINITPGDTFNQTMWDRITSKMHHTYGSKVVLHNAGAAVLPTELNPEDSNHMHRVFYNVTAALFTIIDVVLGDQQEPFSASWIDRDAQKTAVLDYNPLPIDNSVGLPIRDDLSITMRASKGEQGNDLHEQSITLTRVDGFVDLIYVKPDLLPGPYGQPVPSTQSYFPRYVITKADTEIDALTPELMLLAISSTSMLWTNNAWMSAFLPRYGQEEAVMRDFGAVGYEISFTGDPTQMGKIDTRADNFTKADLHALIMKSVRNQPVISIDVEEHGEQSWLSSLFIRAAGGEQDANQMIVQAADNLTEGNFSKIFSSRPQTGIVRDDQNRIHLGYYRNTKGDLRDIRDFDYLAVLNRLGGKDMQAVWDWSATFDDVTIPIELRLEKRLQMLRSLSGESFHLKGYARRVTFVAGFIAALNEACAATGLVVRPTNIDMDLTGTAGRPQFDAAGAAYAGAMPVNMFSFDTGQYRGGYAGVQNSFFSRWGMPHR